MLVVLPSLFDKTYEYVTGMKRVVVFLAAACPCAIGMSVSTAFLGGILSAAEKRCNRKRRRVSGKFWRR